MEGGGGFKLFGVRFSPDSQKNPSSLSPSPSPSSSSAIASIQMRKSVSMGNLSSYGVGREREREKGREREKVREIERGRGVQEIEGSDLIAVSMPETPVEGYASDDLVHSNSNSRERKKGVAWTEEEHRAFLLGLQKLGKGDWRGISRKFVKTRTPTQVASHAQKHFLRRNNLNKRRRRSSLFDITAETVSSFLGEQMLEEPGCDDEDVDACPELRLGQAITYGSANKVELAQLSWRTRQHVTGFSMRMPVVSESTDQVGTTNNMEINEMCETRSSVDPFGEDEVASSDADNNGYKEDLTSNSSSFRNLPLAPLWLGPGSNGFKIVKPTPIVLRPDLKVDDTKPLSSVPRINAVRPMMEPSALSYQLLEEGSRHSAFHTTSSSASSSSSREMDGQANLTHVNAISVP